MADEVQDLDPTQWRLVELHHQKLRCEEAAEGFVEGVVSACLKQFFEQCIGAGEHHAVAGAHGCTPEALREHGFADADR
jgi:hypothetical protein